MFDKFMTFCVIVMLVGVIALIVLFIKDSLRMKIIKKVYREVFGEWLLGSRQHISYTNERDGSYNVCYCLGESSGAYNRLKKSFIDKLDKLKDTVTYTEPIKNGEFVFEAENHVLTVYFNRNIPHDYSSQLKSKMYDFIAIRIKEKTTTEQRIKIIEQASKRMAYEKTQLDQNSLPFYKTCIKCGLENIDTVEEMDVLWEIANNNSINDMTLAINCFNNGKELYEKSSDPT